MALAVAVPTAVQASLGLSTSVEFRSPVAIGMPGVPLATPPASVTDPLAIAADHRRIIGAVDGDGDELRGAVDRGGGERVGQRLPDIERLHRGIAVVQRVSPHAGGGERVAAETVVAPQRRADHVPGVIRIVHVGRVQMTGCDLGARRTIGDAAGLDQAPRGVAGNDGGVVGAVDGDGHQLRGAVDGGDGKAYRSACRRH